MRVGWRGLGAGREELSKAAKHKIFKQRTKTKKIDSHWNYS